mmetsp:Transcript_144128/g.349923  ORF Transcript_144128/g.349923 Transcript_144128/m.349923 type:complete len:152 (+) Transcript_144128:57-512(+)
MAEALAGESRKLADEAGDLLRKAREAVSGSPGAMRRLWRGEQRFFKAEDAFHLFRMRQVETEKEHKAILTRRTYPVFPTAGKSHRADALKLGWTKYPPHAEYEELRRAWAESRGVPLRHEFEPRLLAPEHPCEVPTVWYLSSEIRKTFNWH